MKSLNSKLNVFSILKTKETLQSMRHASKSKNTISMMCNSKF